MNFLSVFSFLLVLTAGVFGFSDITGHPDGNAQMLFFAFLIVFFASLVASRRRTLR